MLFPVRMDIDLYVILGCHHTYTGTVGDITSPGYPEEYDDNLDCTYSITVQGNYGITLTFIQIDIEDDSTCSYDYLQVNYISRILAETFCTWHTSE